jgi:hypothetical protein
MKSLTTMHLGVEVGREGRCRRTARAVRRPNSFVSPSRAEAAGAISAKTTLTKASLTLRSGRKWLRTTRSTG